MSDFEINDGVLVSYRGRAHNLVIPDGVAAIGDRAFSYKLNDFMNGYTVTIPSGVKRIGNEAFQFCRISAVTIPEGCEEIGQGAFYYCNGLESVTIPALS